MREEGKGFSGTCAWTMSVPDVVQSSEGCKPRGSTSSSLPKVSRSVPSAQSVRVCCGVLRLDRARSMCAAAAGKICG